MVGDHQSVKRRFGIWFKPDLCAFVNFLYFIDSSKPEAFSLKKKKRQLQAYDNTYYKLKTSQEALGISTCLCIPSNTDRPRLMPSCTAEQLGINKKGTNKNYIPVIIRVWYRTQPASRR
jgi:hypothetical protein